MFFLSVVSIPGDAIGQGVPIRLDAEREVRLSILLESLVKEESDAERGAAAYYLAFIGPEAKVAVPALTALLSEESPFLRGNAIFALGRIGAPARDAIPRLLAILRHDEDPNIRAISAQAVKELSQAIEITETDIIAAFQKAVPDFIVLLKSEKDPGIRATAAFALGKIASMSEEAIPPLMRCLQHDKDAVVRAEAASALALLIPEAGIPPSALWLHSRVLGSSLIEDDSALVRVGSACALEELLLKTNALEPESEQHILGTLIRSIQNDEDSRVREKVASALGTLGARAQRAVPTLKLVYQEDVSRSVRESALYALNEIGPAKAPLLMRLLQERPRLSIVISAYLLLLPASLFLLWRNPLFLLRINELLDGTTQLTLPGSLGSIKLPINKFLWVGFFHYHNRVLDFWAAKWVAVFRSEFEKLPAVMSRQIRVATPVRLGKETVPHLDSRHVCGIFERRCCLLVWGEGGSGKTTLACQLARWAMDTDSSNWLSDHLMLPVMIEDIDFDLRSEDQLLEAVHGMLDLLTGASTPISLELVRRLLRRRRLLVILDGVSESPSLVKSLQPSRAEFPAHALVVTSRRLEGLIRLPRTVAAQPQRVRGSNLLAFLESYMEERGESFEVGDIIDACQHLTRLVRGRDTTVLFAKLFAEWMIFSRRRFREANFPGNIPELMLSYVNDLNGRVKEGSIPDSQVQSAVRFVAWECLKDPHRPAYASRSDCITACGEHGRDLVRYLEHRLGILETLRPQMDRVRFSLVPLAEYFAAFHVVDQLVGETTTRDRYLSLVRQLDANLNRESKFGRVVLECYLEKGESVDEFVVSELQRASTLSREA